jgi:hypothetical protein
MTFLDIALQHAARGWYVHPLRTKDKRPITLHGFKDATLDEAQVRAWWAKWPTSNVGISCGPSVLCVLDADHGLPDYESFIAWRGRNGLPPTYTVRSGRRIGKDGKPEFGAQMYYAGSLKDGKFELDGVSGEIKSLGGLVMSVGNIHPDTGEVYQLIIDAPLAPVPAIIDQARKRAQQTKAARKPGQLIAEGRNIELCSEVGRFRYKNPGVSEDATVAYMQQWNLENCADPMSCDEVEETTRKQFALYADTEDTPAVELSTPVETSDDVEVVEELDASLRATPLPRYPIEVWEDTLYLEFAKRAALGNFVPPEFFVEGAMTYAGAMCADNLHGLSEEITPRMYTVLLAPPGIGKGTTFRRIRRFAPESRLLDTITDLNAPRPNASVALLARAGSEPGLNDALLAWRCVLLDFEEMDRMMEKTRIEGSGAALMSVIRSLFDDTVPGITTTGKRTEAAQIGFVSLLGAMTPSLWRQAMEGRDSYGSGLGGRFNLIATNEERSASTLMPMDLGDLQAILEAKLLKLETDSPVTIGTESAALAVLDDWWKSSRARPHYNRINVIAHRKALHLAWIRGLPVITREVMLQAVKLADYLVGVRKAFAATKGEDRTAISENRVMHILIEIAPKAVRSKQVVELLDGLMSRASVYRALESLEKSGEAEKHLIRKGDSHRPYAVYRVCLK